MSEKHLRISSMSDQRAQRLVTFIRQRPLACYLTAAGLATGMATWAGGPAWVAQSNATAAVASDPQVTSGTEAAKAESEAASWWSAKRWKNAFSQQPTHEGALHEAPSGLQRLATAIVLENLPATYDDRRKWGMQRERFDGLHVRLDGVKLRTKRKRKAVNHGTWKRYRITQIDPKQNLRFQISPTDRLEDGRVAFTVELESKINAMARLSEWNRGIRLASVSIDADAVVKIVMYCELDVQLDPTRFPPDVVLDPNVADADIQVSKLRVNRISHLKGSLARDLSSSLEKLVEKKIDEKRPKLVRKINRQIEKHRDDLRLSVRDSFVKKWNAFTGNEAETKSK